MSGPLPTSWTDADQAEQDLLVFAFVKAVAVHHERCPVCTQGRGWCLSLSEACEVLLDWRQGRILASRAAYLRSGQDLLDFAGRLGFTAQQVRQLQTKWRAEEVLEVAA